LFKKTAFISIPRGLPTYICKDNSLLKTTTVFYQLKSLYKGGVIINYTSRYSDIANEFNISVSKLRNYIRVLLKKGWVKKENKNMILMSKRYISEGFNISKYCYKIKTTELCNLENIFKALAIQENYNKQEHLLKKRLIKKILLKETEGETCSSKGLKKLESNIKKRVTNNLEDLKQTEYLRFEENPVDSIKKKLINPFITLSRKGVAKLLGRKSKSSGYRNITKLKKNNLVDDQMNYLLIAKDISYNEYINLRYDYLSNGYYITYNKYDNKVYLRLANLIYLKTNLFLFSEGWNEQKNVPVFNKNINIL
jgi:hypothetical protein